MADEDYLERSLRLLDDSINSPDRPRPPMNLGSQMFTDSFLNKTSTVDVNQLDLNNTSRILGNSSNLGEDYLGINESLTKSKIGHLRRSDFNDCSITLNPEEMARLLDGGSNKSVGYMANFTGINDSLTKSRISLPLHQSDFNDCSITLNPGEMSRLLDGGSSKSLGFMANIPETDLLYKEFLEAILSDGNGGFGQVFDVVNEFVRSCVNLLSNKYNSDADIIDPDIVWLENERNTWRLIFALYQDRLYSKNDSTNTRDDEQMEVTLSNRLSEKEIVSRLYKNHNVFRECQIVVDWLEKIAAEQYEISGGPQVGHFTDKTIAWENTLHQLQNKNVSYSSTRPLITNLDPDAPLRLKNNLHDMDIEDEARILQQVFTEIRCGRLDQAHSVCYHAGQPWRAATLEGWRLHHDPNYNLPPNTEKLPVEGNPQRDLWKLCAWRLSDDVRASPLARAVHGALCGHLQSLIGVCKGWDDLLWAHVRVLVDVRVEQEIRANCFSHKEYVELPDSYWNQKLNLEEIFTELEACRDINIKSESSKPERIVQKLLILNRIPELMVKMDEWIKADNCKPQFIRFLSHLVLILRYIGENNLENFGHDIIKAYIKILVNQRDPELVAFYVSTLPQEDQIAIYANYLVTVTNSDERESCLKAAETFELKVESITQRVVEIIRNNNVQQSNKLNLLNEINEDDLAKVSALDWVVFYPQQRGEALWQANAIIRSFLALGKLDAARMAFNKLPSDSIELLAAQHQIEPGMQGDVLQENNKLPLRTAAAIREYLSHKAYLDAQEGFSDWFQHYHNAKPLEPNKLSDSATFTEKVAYDHKRAQYNKDYERWKSTTAHQTKCVKKQLYNVILFPDGGWLVDIETEDHLRQQQMSALRSLCIPQIVLLLHTVLQSSGEYNECMKLADLIVSEEHQLYKVYSKQQLTELLGKLSETSLSLLENKRDPWGYPLSF